jgi:molybdate transport system substrate-binding protein
MSRRAAAFILAVCALLFAASARADALSVAVAANFVGTLKQLAPLFQRASGHTLALSPGSSGQLYAQIQHGAPYDVMLSADSERARKLEQAGLAVRGSRFTYAQGKLVLWSPKPGVIDAHASLLKRADPPFVAIADPANAPYGAAAAKALTALALLPQLRAAKKLVLGESVAQAYQFAASGHAACAFIALAQVQAPDGTVPGSYWLVPPALYGRLDQDAVLLSASKRVPVAQQFMAWLRTDPQALALIRAAGYGVPSR